jgi:hypothetical protein
MKTQFEGLKFVTLQKVDDFVGVFKQEKGVEYYPVLFFAVYIDVKDQNLEFYPVFESDLIDGWLDTFTCSNYKGVEKSNQ